MSTCIKIYNGAFPSLHLSCMHHFWNRCPFFVTVNNKAYQHKPARIIYSRTVWLPATPQGTTGSHCTDKYYNLHRGKKTARQGLFYNPTNKKGSRHVRLSAQMAGGVAPGNRGPITWGWNLIGPLDNKQSQDIQRIYHLTSNTISAMASRYRVSWHRHRCSLGKCTMQPHPCTALTHTPSGRPRLGRTYWRLRNGTWTYSVQRGKSWQVNFALFALLALTGQSQKGVKPLGTCSPTSVSNASENKLNTV